MIDTPLVLHIYHAMCTLLLRLAACSEALILLESATSLIITSQKFKLASPNLSFNSSRLYTCGNEIFFDGVCVSGTLDPRNTRITRMQAHYTHTQNKYAHMHVRIHTYKLKRLSCPCTVMPT